MSTRIVDPAETPPLKPNLSVPAPDQVEIRLSPQPQEPPIETVSPAQTLALTDNSPAALNLLRKRSRLGESFIQILILGCGLISVAITAGIVYVLGREALLFFTNPEVRPLDFITTFKWSPNIYAFGIWPLVTATLVTSVVAILVAMPLGLAAAVFLSEYASPRVRGVLKPTLEILAGIPTVVYGYFALTFVTPGLRALFGVDTVEIYNMASAGLVIGIMIMPLITSMSEDALSAVPRALREGAYGLGATRLETAIQVVVPAAFSGIVAAFIIGISRAFGETMIVAIAAGAGPKLTFNPFDSAETIAGHIVRISGGDLSYASLDYESLFALALVLFVITLVLNVISRRVVARFREAYE